MTAAGAVDLRGAARRYYAWGWIAHPTDDEKRPLLKWGRLREQSPSLAEIEAFPWERAHGLALLTWPAGQLVVLDFDGPCAMAAWKATAIDLPPTAAVRTRSGGLHAIYHVPAQFVGARLNSQNGDPRRKVRLVTASGCRCEKPCGVDLLVNGYFVTVPTPGYGEVAGCPFEPSQIKEIPQAVLDLARAAEGNGGQPGTAGPISERILSGQRNATLASLAGTLRRLDPSRSLKFKPHFGWSGHIELEP